MSERGFLMQNALYDRSFNPTQAESPVRRPLLTRDRLYRWGRRASVFITPLLVLLLWELATTLGWVAPYLLPPPEAVASEFAARLTDGETFLLDSSLWRHTRVTMSEVLAGLGVGLSIGVALGYLIARSPLLEALVSPLVVAFQSTPIVAYAPLLVIWFGSGMESKVITSVLIVFFPMLMNTIVGIRGVPRELRDLMRVSRANWWQTFTKLELPAAMPVLMTGAKTSATLAVIGAVVGEFVVANAGLGFLINGARQQYDTALVFVAALTLALMAGLLYSAVSLLERRVLAWQRRNGS